MEPEKYRPQSIPTDPGVYRFFDEKDRVIYVGKAKNLKNRINNYFQSNLTPKTYRMVNSAVRVDWTIVKTELEALQLEFNWIKKENPKFNIQFRDDKSYPYLGVSIKERFPRLFITRRKNDSNVKYFGPYAHAWALHSTFEVLQKLFPIRTCQDRNFDLAKKSGRNCLLGDIGKCCAPCVGRTSEEEHRKIALDLIKFVDSSPDKVLKELERQMNQASIDEEYEKAAKFRDQIHAINRSIETAGTFLSDSITADLVAIHKDITHAAVTLFRVQSGRINASKSWVIDLAEVLEENGIMQAALSKIYSEFSPPSEILISEEIGDQSTWEEYLSSLAGLKVELKRPLKGDKADLMATVKRNANEALIQYLSKRSNDAAVAGKALEELLIQLDLPELPLRIECFDISNTQGTNSVGSMVVFEDGQAKKSDYRRFAISDGSKLDDARALAQVVRRRFKRYLSEKEENLQDVKLLGGEQSKFAYPPQLVVVDGGSQQVRAAAQVLGELGLSDIAIVGLAKRLEEVWTPDSSNPIILPRNSEGLYLLQRIRDEAHRFAITYHRSKRSKMMLDSLLDEIPKLGESRRKILLEKFGSVSGLKKASISEIAQIPGIGAKLAEVIFTHLHGVEGKIVDTETGEISLT